LGVRVSMDDFAAGHSSLSRLAHLPLDEVRVKADFMAAVCDEGLHEEGMTVIQSIIDLCHDRRLQVVASGVVTTAMWRLAADLGCDLVQGEAVSPPLDPTSLSRWLEAGGLLPSSSVRQAS
ncbi:MAG: EAL domain-containing protein, partial [Mycobacterium sp.]